MVSFTRCFASLISSAMLLAACVQAEGDYGFRIQKVAVSTGYRALNARIDQQLSVSEAARSALEHGVPLTVQLEVELRDARSLTLLFDDSRRFEIRYLPMLEDYQLIDLHSGTHQAFPRLRHVLRALGDLDVELKTGPLGPGQYELRARSRIENARLPAPMRLPARFSPQWQHQSEWSTWPFEIGV